MKCYCWMTGRIELGRKCPQGAIELHSGPAKALRRHVEVIARHGYAEGLLLVPGVPEADSVADKVAACIRFARCLAERMAKGTKPQ